MLKSKIMYLSSSTSDFDTSKFRREYGISSYPILKRRTIICNILLFIGYYFFSPLLFLIYGDWKYHIDDYDIIILDTRRPSKYAIKMIKRKKKRLIMFYWNTISRRELQPDFIKQFTNEILTFDKNDALRYGIGFNDTCIYDKILKKNMSNLEENTAYYLGVNKNGREDILEMLEGLLKDKKIICNFNLVNCKNDKFKSSSMKYEEYLQDLSKSRYVIEIVSKGQTGLTLRSIEALYYKKKLITNNEAIKNYKFYDESRILLLSQIDKLDDFINTDYTIVEDGILNYYYFENWLERLIGEKIE